MFLLLWCCEIQQRWSCTRSHSEEYLYLCLLTSTIFCYCFLFGMSFCLCNNLYCQFWDTQQRWLNTLLDIRSQYLSILGYWLLSCGMNVTRLSFFINWNLKKTYQQKTWVKLSLNSSREQFYILFPKYQTNKDEIECSVIEKLIWELKGKRWNTVLQTHLLLWNNLKVSFSVQL